ncbi:hypothetical protein OQX63_17365 [Pedobacter sp. PF22-3]|uniref:hypothetical protein n=1 Tax=Pedobacter sp. PF22-3 TaxID=2994467 RepID=UPI002247D366|nr:hypothetical protein [Pedobacter sp. PF22-3]MCX2495263.1 hypothetical protein [Pedobacter sp. PF22-3]
MKLSSKPILYKQGLYRLIASILIVMSVTELSSCGKGNDPVPNPLSTVTPPPPDNGNTGGNTGGTGSTNKGYVFRNKIAWAAGVDLDANNDKIIQLGVDFMFDNSVKYSTKGNTVKIIPKRFEVAKPIYQLIDLDPYSYFIEIENVVPREYKESDLDSTKAVFQVIDPAQKDKDGKQIIDLIYLYNISPGSTNGFFVGGGKKLNGQPIPIKTILDKISNSSYKRL